MRPSDTRAETWGRHAEKDHGNHSTRKEAEKTGKKEKGTMGGGDRERRKLQEKKALHREINA